MIQPGWEVSAADVNDTVWSESKINYLIKFHLIPNTLTFSFEVNDTPMISVNTLQHFIMGDVVEIFQTAFQTRLHKWKIRCILRWKVLPKAEITSIHEIVYNCSIAFSRYRDAMTILIASENSFQRELPKKL